MLLRLISCRSLFFCLCVVLGFTVSVHGQNNDANERESQVPDIKAQATSHLDAGEPEQAYSLLSGHLSEYREDAEYLFLIGMAAMETGRPGVAADHFEAALEQNPDLPRVRLELGRAYEAVNRNDKAKAEFDRVLEMQPPPQVRNNIEQYQSYVDEKKNWQARFAVGYLYDDNVNAGPQSNTVELFGIPFELDPGAQQKSDGAITTAVDVDHLFPLDNHWTLRSNLSFNSVTYFSESQFNTENISFSTGPSHRWGKTTFAIPAILEYSRLGSERYAFAYGIGPQVQHALTDRVLLRASASAQLNEHWARPEREGNLWSARGSVRYLLNAQSYVEAGYRFRHENTKVDFLDNDLHAVSVAYYTQLPWAMEFFVRPEIGWNEYEAAEAAFSSARDETRFTLDLNLSKEIGDTGFVASFGYTFTNNDSNIGLFEFDRNQIMFQISKSF